MMTTACNAAKSTISEDICYTLNVSKYYYNELNMLSETFLMSDAIVLVCKLNLKILRILNTIVTNSIIWLFLIDGIVILKLRLFELVPIVI